MKKVIKISLTLLIGSTLSWAGANTMKLYDVKSAKIEYEIKGSGDIMGMVQIKTVGKKRLIFDKYGGQNLVEENKVSQKTTNGRTNVEKVHTIAYMKNGMIYQVDFDNRRIMRMENMAAAMGSLMGGGTDMQKSGEAMMKQMGGKKTGTDSVLGYTCNVWELMGTKQCIYKGVPLKVESDIMGIQNSEVATKVEFDLSLNSNDFKLPDFPIYDMEGNKLDKTKLDAMDNASQKSMEKSGEEMAEMRKIMEEAAKNVGIQHGQTPTDSQQQDMETAMMTAMFPRMKKEILSEEKMMRFGYSCLSSADTLKEANICNDKTNAMSGEAEEPFDVWDSATKKEVLGFLKKYLNEMIPCVKKAQTVEKLRACMPME